MYFRQERTLFLKRLLSAIGKGDDFEISNPGIDKKLTTCRCEIYQRYIMIRDVVYPGTVASLEKHWYLALRSWFLY